MALHALAAEYLRQREMPMPSAAAKTIDGRGASPRTCRDDEEYRVLLPFIKNGFESVEKGG